MNLKLGELEIYKSYLENQIYFYQLKTITKYY